MSIETLDDFINKYKLPITNVNLLQQALTHRSFLEPNNLANPSLYNESLEFLGDSILNFVITDYLYCNFKNKSEGELSKLKSAVVSKSILFDLAVQFNIKDLLRHRIHQKNIENTEYFKPYADVIEAIIAAVYMNRGLEITKAFILDLFAPFINDAIHGLNELDYKSLLQDYTQKTYNIKPSYILKKSTGPDHKKIFSVIVEIFPIKYNRKNLINEHSNTYGPSMGSSRKLAEQKVAKVAYLAICK